MNISDSIITLLSAGTISSIVIFLGKRIIDKSLDLGVEKYKSDLNQSVETHKAELSKQTEEFKATLRILELEHQVKYSKLHEMRASAIQEIHSLLIETQEKLSNMTTMFQGPEWSSDTEKETNATTALEDLKKYFLKTRFYFSEDLCTKMDLVLKSCFNIIVDMSVAKTEAKYLNSGPEMAKIIKEWRDIDKRVSQEINTARLDLEKEFRTLIGVVK